MQRKFDSGTAFLALKVMDRGTLNEGAFHRMISFERRRAKRSLKLFLLMLLDIGEHATSKKNHDTFQKILSALSAITRETDVTGWYKNNSIVGVMFTEITLDERNSIPPAMMKRVSKRLHEYLTPHQLHQIGVSFHLLPEAPEPEFSEQPSHPALYPSLSIPEGVQESSL